MVGLGRFELPTSPLSGVRSNQLSYRPPARKPQGGHQLAMRAGLTSSVASSVKKEKRRRRDPALEGRHRPD